MFFSPCWLRRFLLFLRSQRTSMSLYMAARQRAWSPPSALRARGAKVALLEPRKHLGGMVTGGLSRTDYGVKETIGGYSLDFFQRIGKHYGQEIAWYPEPDVAEKVFSDWIKETGVNVFFGYRLQERNGAKKVGSRLTEITMENGTSFRAKGFVDAS